MGLITYENLEDGQKVTANVFNERFAQIVAQLNGKIGEVNLENASVSKEKLQAEVYESLYPVGSMYVNFTDNTNPATLLGFGVWTAVEGRTVVGYDATQAEFNAAEKTGGSKTNTHTHWTGTSNDGSAQYQTASNVITANGGRSRVQSKSRSSIGASSSTTNTREDSTYPETIDILQPYIVGYVWKRVS